MDSGMLYPGVVFRVSLRVEDSSRWLLAPCPDPRRLQEPGRRPTRVSQCTLGEPAQKWAGGPASSSQGVGKFGDPDRGLAARDHAGLSLHAGEYLAMMREAVPGYDRMEDETVAATGTGAKSVLELGIGTGETARRVLARHPEAKLIGVDGSPGMVGVARDSLPSDRVSVLVGSLEDPLPDGPFDLVVSALAVHHLQADSKADLFRRIAEALEPGGRFVLADVVTPLNPSYVVTAIDPAVDYPSTLEEQLTRLDAAGMNPEVTWTHRDLVVIVGTAWRSALRLESVGSV